MPNGGIQLVQCCQLAHRPTVLWFGLATTGRKCQNGGRRHASIETANSIVLDVNVESGVARIPQHVTPRVVGVIVGTAKFDIRLLLMVLRLAMLLVAIAVSIAVLAGTRLLGPLDPRALVAAAHAPGLMGLQIGQALLPVLAFDRITCGGFNATSPVGNGNGPTGKTGLPFQLADVPIGVPVGSADDGFGR